MASNRRQATPYSAAPPKAFHEGPGRLLSRGRQNTQVL